MTNTEKLLADIDRLRALLLDPHPGLATWQECYREALAAVSSWWTGDEPTGKSIYSYSGNIYVRPCSRGVVLRDDSRNLQLEDVIPAGNWYMQVVVTEMPKDDGQ